MKTQNSKKLAALVKKLSDTKSNGAKKASGVSCRVPHIYCW